MEAGPRVLRRAAVWQLNEANATRAVGFGAARDCTLHVDHPCGYAYGDLRLNALTVCAYSRRAVDHASIMHRSFAPRKGHHISGLFFVRNL